MSGNPIDPTEPAPSGRSRYEDYDLTVPTAQAGPKRRTPTLTVAAVVLLVAGLMGLGVAWIARDSALSVAVAAFGAAEVVCAVLVLLLVPAARVAAIVLASVGIVIGLLQARETPVNGLISLALYAYVIYAMASSGPAFRRE
jgi:hypothetical protein